MVKKSGSLPGKLVRDKLVTRIPAEELLRVDVVGDAFQAYFGAKLDEECRELRRSGFKDLKEFADVFEVLLALAAQQGLDLRQIQVAAADKLERSGGFKDGLVWKACAMETPEPLIYLTAPYTHVDQEVARWRMEQLQVQTAQLINAGFRVVAPLVHNHR